MVFVQRLFLSLFLLTSFQCVVVAQSNTDSLELALRFAKKPAAQITLLLKLSDEFKNNNPAKALAFAEQANEISVKNKDEYNRLQAVLRLAQITWGTSDFKPAMVYAEQANELAETLHQQKQLAQALRIKGLIFNELSDFEKSAELFFSSLKLFEEINDKEGTATLLSDIGSVNFYQQNFEKALEYYFRSLNLAKEIHNKTGISRALNNIAAVYEFMKEYEKAGEYFSKAIPINKELGNKRGEGINYMNLGAIRFNMKDYEASLDYLQQALSIFLDLESKLLQARCHVNLAGYYLETKQPKKALDFATKALETGRQQDLKQIVHDAAEIIRQIYLEQGNKAKAYDFAVLQYQMKDSLILMENKTELTKLELQYEFDKTAQTKRIAQQRKDLIILIVIITLLIALIVIILIWVRQRVKAKNALFRQQQLEHKLEFKNKELTANVMSLMKKNEILSTISDKLINIKTQAVKEETKEAISKISKEIQKITNEEILHEFELRFKEVHNDFYHKLRQKFPTLTPSEQRLCAFLRLNMTTKEIAELTGQQPSSLETARYRLRKKLGISNSHTNLVIFLSQI